MTTVSQINKQTNKSNISNILMNEHCKYCMTHHPFQFIPLEFFFQWHRELNIDSLMHDNNIHIINRERERVREID